MAVEIVQLVQGVLMIKATGELNEQDIDQLQSATRQAVGQWVTIRVLMILDGFDGWTPDQLGDGAGFMTGDGRVVDKIAVVGDGQHEEGVRSYLGWKLPAAAVGYFPPADRDRAVIWIVDGL